MAAGLQVMLAAVAAAALLLAGGAVAAAPAPASQSDLDAVAVEAYLYFYPLVMMDVTRRVLLSQPPKGKTPAGPNIFDNVPAFPSATDRSVVRPNFDTLYSTAWLDLSKGPVVVSSKDTNGRYYLLPLLDMWTDVFAVPGARTSGTQAGAWAVTPPGWTGQLPKDVQRIDAPTPFVWVIGRTQTNGPSDYAAVHKVQDGYRITPLAQWGSANVTLPPYKPDPSVDTKTDPLKQVNSLPADKFFPYAANLMKTHRPHITDWSQTERIRRFLGIEPGKGFDWKSASPQVQGALTRATKTGLDTITAKVPTIAPIINGWQMNTNTMGVYGNYYLKRAAVALLGLGANQPEDAIYPIALADADGKKIASPTKYTLTFSKGQLPPVGAFWSITMYDAEGYQVANPLNRFALGDRDKLQYAPDGSLTIYIQPDAPSDKSKQSNWLPAPKTGELGITMRLYAPKAAALQGDWVPPAIKKAA